MFPCGHQKWTQGPEGEGLVYFGAGRGRECPGWRRQTVRVVVEEGGVFVRAGRMLGAVGNGFVGVKI
jgi:hypothetical protein